ncbi:MAG TPA: Ig-like domain-containing protein [Gemmatimonadaceae bacterium]|nr:Ig-like domain-containing protein [Gemmatimonadaceae bacterium]
MRLHHIISITARTSLLSMLLVAEQSAMAQRGMPRGPRAEKPTGAEIALKARTMRLDRANAGLGEFQGKRISFTPAVLDPRADLAAGQVIGLLENDVEGDETGLPPGRYNVFAVQLPDGWHVYAESGGQIVREALRVTVTARKGTVAEKKPRIRPVGWGVDMDRTRDELPPPPAPVATINIVGNGTALVLGEKRQYAIELRDASGTLLIGRSVTWASSAPSAIGAPSLGVASALTGGTSATLTATSEGKIAQLPLSVTPIQYAVRLGGVGYADGAYSLTTSVGASYYVSASVSGTPCMLPCPATNWSELTWTSSAPTIARVTPGANGQARIDGVAEGTATITASYRGAVAPLTVTVGRARVTSIAFSPTSVTVNQGLTQQLSIVVKDATGALVTDRPITWRSSTPSVADVTSSGRVAGIVPGDAWIYVYVDNASSSVPVRVIPPAVATVTVDPATISVEQNQWGALTATLRDQSGAVLTNRSIVWTSSNPAVAEVTYNGRVVGVAAGIATITATSEGRGGRSTVTVTAPAVANTDRLTESISFNW